jgi:hypothetical protein
MLGSLAVLLAVAGLSYAQGTAPEKLGPPSPKASTPADEGNAFSGPGTPSGAFGGAPGQAADAGPGCPVPPGIDLPPFDEGAASPAKKGLSETPPPWCEMYQNWGPHVWLDADYLHYWFKQAPLGAPLLTTGPVPLNPLSGFAVLNQPGTQVVIGNQTLDQSQSDGARITLGGWLDPFTYSGQHTIGVEASYFVLPRVVGRLFQGGDATGNPVLARPVVDATTGQETSFIVSAPGLFVSTPQGFTVTTSTEMWGAELNTFMPFYGSCHFMFGGLAGFRYINLEESLEISQTSSPIRPGIAFFNQLAVSPGQMLNIFDDFETKNNFYGGQVGLNAAFHYGRLSVDASGKVALGTMHQVVQIQGSTTLNAGGISQSIPGGLLALSTNPGSGRYEFAVVPEANVTIGFQIHERINVHAGWSFLYANSVVRPGEQIDRVINGALLPSSQNFNTPPVGEIRPTFQFQKSEFWATGLNAGLTISF